MKLFKVAALFAACISVSAGVNAGWGSSEERVGGKDTWLYTPNSSIAGNPNIIDGKRALMINLHGCAQSNEDLKDAGNWANVAEEYGMVVAIPFAGVSYPGCWDYHLAIDDSNHAAVLANIAQQLTADPSLSIDPNQVYVSGLSSGGAMAVQLACEYPQLFAGIGSVAGPSIGSDQDAEALGDAPSNNVSRGIAICNQRAGANAPYLQTQISSMAYGDLDKNGNGASAYGQGTIALVDVEWAKDNAAIMKSIYGAGSLGATETLIDNGGATADVRVSMRGGQEVISLVELNGVGHAWPGGDKGTEWISGGAYVNKSGFAYPVYLTQWLFVNNLRSGGIIIVENNTPVISLPAGPYVYGIGDDCVPSATAYDIEEGDLTADIEVSGSVDCNVAGNHTLTYSVEDAEGASDSETITITVNGSGSLFDEEASGTCIAHYVAQRLPVSEFISCGSANGYSSSVTLYRFGSCWTESSDGC